MRIAHRLFPARLGAVRLHPLRFFGRLLPGAARPIILPSLCVTHAKIHRSAQRGEQKCVPVQGRCDSCHQFAVACMRLCLRASVSTGPPTAGYHNARLEAGEVRCSVSLSRHPSFPCAASDKTTARFRVCRSVRNVRGHSRLCGCFAVGRTRSACLVWSRPCVCEQVQSAFHVLAG